MKIQSVNSDYAQSVSHKAYIPKTLAKKSADKLAKEFINSGEATRVNIGERYFKALETLKNEKGIKEAAIIAALSKNTAQVVLDGYSCDGFHFDDEISKSLNKSKLFAYDAIKAVIAAGRDAWSIVNKLQEYHNLNRPRRDWHE